MTVLDQEKARIGANREHRGFESLRPKPSEAQTELGVGLKRDPGFSKRYSVKYLTLNVALHRSGGQEFLYLLSNINVSYKKGSVIEGAKNCIYG